MRELGLSAEPGERFRGQLQRILGGESAAASELAQAALGLGV
jgi:hypothetical protein